jgi:flavin-dependent dehydrogenase
MNRVIVAGGGPVGLAAAIYARTAGFAVTVFEPRTIPVDKACGEGVMPGAVTELARLGIRPVGLPFRGIRYLNGSAVAESMFPSRPGLGVRRTVLSAALLERALGLGVEVEPTAVNDLWHGADSLRLGTLEADWLIAADGLHSQLRGLVTAAHGRSALPRNGLPRYGLRSYGLRRYGLRRHYRMSPWTDLVEVHWSSIGEAYVTPVAPDLVGVAVLSTRDPGAGRSFDELLAHFPALAERLLGVATAGRVLGAGPLRQRVHHKVAGRVLLVGDAAGYVDALTGEGIAMGLRTAKAAVACLAANRPQDYDRAWREITREYRVLTHTLVEATRVPLIRRNLVPAAAATPWLFDAAIRSLAR